MSASDSIHRIGGSEFLSPPIKSDPLPFSDVISLYKGFLPFLGDFTSFYKETGPLLSAPEVDFCPFKLQYIQNENISAMGLCLGTSLDFHFPL